MLLNSTYLTERLELEELPKDFSTAWSAVSSARTSLKYKIKTIHHMLQGQHNSS